MTAAGLAQEGLADQADEQRVEGQLDGTRWAIEVIPLAGGPDAGQQDTLSFQSRTVTSEHLASAGYEGAPYSLSIGGDGVPVWEMLQANPGDGVAFWRGELRGSTISGVLSRQSLVPGETPQDFAFSGAETSGKAVGSSPESPAASTPALAAPAAAPTDAPAATPKPAKKRRKRR